MSDNQPYLISANDKRRFACFPAAVVVFIVNEEEKILLLSHPKRQGWWEVVNGALEAGETILEGALRETREEAGPEVRVRPLGIFHAHSFHFDENVRYMLSLFCLMAYKGGLVQPGDDMAGSQFRWWSWQEISDEKLKIVIPPPGQEWLLQRAIELYRLWKDQDVILQPESELSLTRKKRKYELEKGGPHASDD